MRSAIISWLPFTVYRQMSTAQPTLFPLTDYRVLEPVNPSTITIGGRFTEIALNERTDVERFTPAPPVMMVGSNFGERTAPGFRMPERKQKTTKRGRKPKPKEPKKRVQGSGKYFNSQITFILQSAEIAGKIYKFKVFRNGKFQVPGVLSRDQSDVEKPLAALCSFLRSAYNNPRVEVADRGVQMRNCKTVLASESASFNTSGLGMVIAAAKEAKDPIGIYSVDYKSPQVSAKVTVKFCRPTPANPQKTTTLKILKRKVDFEGGVDSDGVMQIYEWLNTLIVFNYDKCVADSLAVAAASDSSDTDDPERPSVGGVATPPLQIASQESC